MTERYKGELHEQAPQAEIGVDDALNIQLASNEIAQIDAQRQKVDNNKFYLNNGEQTGYWNFTEGIKEIKKIDHYRTPWDKLKDLERIHADVSDDMKIIEDRVQSARNLLARLENPTEESARLQAKIQEAVRHMDRVKPALAEAKEPLRQARKDLVKELEAVEAKEAEAARKRAEQLAA
jgi:hypothetical protein